MLYLKYIHHDLCAMRIAPQHACYYTARELAVEPIQAIEKQIGPTRRAPRYIWIGDTDKDGNPGPIENDGPWKLFEEITRLAAQNPTVVALLEAQDRVDLVARPSGDGDWRAANAGMAGVSRPEGVS